MSIYKNITADPLPHQGAVPLATHNGAPVEAHVDALARKGTPKPPKIPYAGKELPDGRCVGTDVNVDQALAIAQGRPLDAALLGTLPIGEPIPQFLKDIPANERGMNDKKAIEMGKALAAEKDKLPVPPASDGRLAKALDEQKAEKAAARIGSLKAAKAKLVPHDKPLEGKAALDAIRDAQAEVAAADKKSADQHKAVNRVMAAKRPGKAADALKAEKAVQIAPKTKDAPRASVMASGYDWAKAEEYAGNGVVPPLPRFASYAPHLARSYEMAKKNQADELRKYRAQFKPGAGRANLFRYIDLCLTALSVK